MPESQLGLTLLERVRLVDQVIFPHLQVFSFLVDVSKLLV